MALHEDIIGSVANANLKNLGEAPAFYMALAMGDAVAHQRNTNAIREAALGSILKKLTEMDSEEAISILKSTSGNEVASQMANLLAALNSGQQGVKSAQTTPPATP